MLENSHQILLQSLHQKLFFEARDFYRFESFSLNERMQRFYNWKHFFLYTDRFSHGRKSSYLLDEIRNFLYSFQVWCWKFWWSSARRCARDEKIIYIFEILRVSAFQRWVWKCSAIVLHDYRLNYLRTFLAGRETKGFFKVLISKDSFFKNSINTCFFISNCFSY